MSANSVVAQTFAALTGNPTDNTALATALAGKADVGSVPGVLLRSQAARQGTNQGSAQIFGGGNPSSVQLAAGQLATVSQRISVRFVASKNGTTDALVVLMYLGTAGTIADTTIGTTGAQPLTTTYYEGEWIIQRVTATSVQVYLRQVGGATAIQAAAFTVPNLDTNAARALGGASRPAPRTSRRSSTCEMELR
jgi:hypothetical protein